MMTFWNHRNVKDNLLKMFNLQAEGQHCTPWQAGKEYFFSENQNIDKDYD